MYENKIVSGQDLAPIVRAGQRKGKHYGVAVGTFNLARGHHFSLFEEASQWGSVIVIVAMNLDDSLRRYRNGNGRDDLIFPYYYRALLVAASPHVSYVTGFPETKATRLLADLKADEYWKGSDRTINTVDHEERKIANDLGIAIRFSKEYTKESADLEKWLENYGRWLDAGGTREGTYCSC